MKGDTRTKSVRFRVTTGRGGPGQEVEATPVGSLGVLAVHPSPNDPRLWSVSHIPSGLCITYATSEREATALARRIDSEVDPVKARSQKRRTATAAFPPELQDELRVRNADLWRSLPYDEVSK